MIDKINDSTKLVINSHDLVNMNHLEIGGIILDWFHLNGYGNDVRNLSSDFFDEYGHGVILNEIHDSGCQLIKHTDKSNGNIIYEIMEEIA